jgi:hypothetical protein
MIMEEYEYAALLWIVIGLALVILAKTLKK